MNILAMARGLHTNRRSAHDEATAAAATTIQTKATPNILALCVCVCCDACSIEELVFILHWFSIVHG
jgi:hypothetical protein